MELTIENSAVVVRDPRNKDRNHYKRISRPPAEAAQCNTAVVHCPKTNRTALG
jgi:hypothetical protein